MCPQSLYFSLGKHLFFLCSCSSDSRVCVPPKDLCIVLSLTFLFISMVVCGTKSILQGRWPSQKGVAFLSSLNTISLTYENGTHPLGSPSWFTQWAIDLYQLTLSYRLHHSFARDPCHSISWEETYFVSILWKVLSGAFWRSSCTLTMAFQTHGRHSLNAFWVNEWTCPSWIGLALLTPWDCF